MSKKRFIMLFSFIMVIGVAVFLFLQPDKEQTQPVPSDPSEQETEEEATVEKPEEEESLIQTVRERMVGVFTFLQNDTHITAIGDSLTQGVGDEFDNGGYVGILEDQLEAGNVRVTIDNFGVRGNRTDHLLERLEEKPEINESLEEADIVLITIGANDIMQITKDNFMNLTEEPFINEREPYSERLTNILEHMTEIQPEARIYLLGIFNPFEMYFGEIEELDRIVTQWNNTSLQVTNQFEQARFIPMQDIFQHTNGDVFAEDNFHPNHSGYQLMADRVITYLQNDIQEAQN
ncbi:SGNH/GDSL hydrolase family protein [Gracilibacillus alcaliphilus]|uniref:SGNH/GDSL hydrolase family protein n=1 Tax=Gracilibacillus alcaliphilus TaxID=1401441 RepID=UPI00195C4B34|nr:SGNH/GDSL hydrolase family protein [Gracilibacillus alcaliphilus]MBM7677292.1 lysophospholipase L1-like esterase [Gracilibacillus alcaliphilus]